MSAIPHLAMWADKIILMVPSHRTLISPADQYKIRIFNVGPDRWSNPYNAELQELIGRMADAEGF